MPLDVILLGYNAATTALQPPLPDDVWRAWNWDPLLLLGLLLGAVFYLRGVRRLWRSAGPGRGVSFGQVLAFTGGLIALLVALISPLEAMSDALLSAHMVQHLLLMLVAAPLLLLGAPPVALAWGLNQTADLARWWHRRAGLRRLWRLVFRPSVAWIVFNAVLWVWHAPALYEAAILDERLHIIEHIVFLAAALFFWSTLLHSGHKRTRGRPSAAGPLYVFTTALLSGLLGVLLTFSQTVWYPVYGVVPYGWGITPLQDQQLAGVIMWFPGGLIYLAVLLLLLGSALQQRAKQEGSMRAVVAPQRESETEVRISKFEFPN